MESANRLISQVDLREKASRVAWLRVGALGDLLVGLASLAECSKLFPNAKITVIGPKVWCEILAAELYTYVEKIAVIEKRGQTAEIYLRQINSATSSWTWMKERTLPLSEVFKAMSAVVNTNIDSYRYGLAALKAGVPLRVGSAPREMAWIYTYSSPFFGKDPVLHERDAPLLLLEFAQKGFGRMLKSTIRNRQELPDLIKQSKFIQDWRSRGLPRGKDPNPARAEELTGCRAGHYVLVNPTSSRREKAWPARRFREFVQTMQPVLREQGCEILILGAKHETDWLNEVCGREFRLVQPPTIADLQDVLFSARGLLTNTSSVQFIAAMTGTPTLTLMGRARAEIWGPIGTCDRYVSPAVLQNDTDVTDIFAEEQRAYESIAIETVAPVFLKLIERSRRPEVIP